MKRYIFGVLFVVFAAQGAGADLLIEQGAFLNHHIPALNTALTARFHNKVLIVKSWGNTPQAGVKIEFPDMVPVGHGHCDFQAHSYNHTAEFFKCKFWQLDDEGHWINVNFMNQIPPIHFAELVNPPPPVAPVPPPVGPAPGGTPPPTPVIPAPPAPPVTQ